MTAPEHGPESGADLAPDFAPVTQDAPGVARWLHLAGDWRRPGRGGAYDLFRRQDDGYAQVLPRPSATQAAAFYDLSDYYTHGTAADGAGRSASWLWRVLVALSWRRDHGVTADAAWWQARLGAAPQDVLEIGCGAGQTLELLAGLGHRVTGVEPDPAARQVAAGRGLTVLDGTAEALPPALQGRRFDCVFLFHVLEHCIDPLAALRNARTLLRDGGLLLVEVPNNACRGAALFGASWYWLDVPRHLNFFTPTSLDRVTRAAGFASQGVEYWGYCRQFAADWAGMQRHIAPLVGDRRGGQTWRYLVLLAQTAFAGHAAKYDSVRILARTGTAATASPTPRGTS